MAEDEAPSGTAAYTWTVTAFYAVAIAANLFILWKTYGDGPEGELAKRRVKDWWDRVTRSARERREFASAARHVEFEAYSTVVDAERERIDLDAD